MFCYWEPEGSQCDDILTLRLPLWSGPGHEPCLSDPAGWPNATPDRAPSKKNSSASAKNPSGVKFQDPWGIFRCVSLASDEPVSFSWSFWRTSVSLTSAWNVRFLADENQSLEQMVGNGWHGFCCLAMSNRPSKLHHLPMTQVIWVVPIPHSSAKPPKLYPVITR